MHVLIFLEKTSVKIILSLRGIHQVNIYALLNA